MNLLTHAHGIQTAKNMTIASKISSGRVKDSRMDTKLGLGTEIEPDLEPTVLPFALKQDNS